MSSNDFRLVLGLDSGEFCVEAVGDRLPSSCEEGISSDFRTRSSSASTAFGARLFASRLMNAKHISAPGKNDGY